MTAKTFSKETKIRAAAVLFPIPYYFFASVICILWHIQVPSEAKSGAWFELCMPDGLFFNFGLMFLLLVSLVFFVPLVISLRRDWRSQGVEP